MNKFLSILGGILCIIAIATAALCFYMAITGNTALQESIGTPSVIERSPAPTDIQLETK